MEACVGVGYGQWVQGGVKNSKGQKKKEKNDGGQ